MVNISVVMPTCNRSQYITLALNSVFAQTFADQEIIVVDDGSTDDTPQILLAFRDKIKYIRQENQGSSGARNRGIKESRGGIIAFMDDDCTADPEWLASIAELFKNQACAAMGGRILPVFPPETPQWIKTYGEMLRGPIVSHDYGEDIKLYQKPMVEMVGANMAFRREVFDQVGSFLPHLGAGKGGIIGEETELFNRLVKNGKEVYYCGKALVRHPVEVKRMTLRYIAQWNIALGKYRFTVDDAGKIEPGLVYCFGIPRYILGQILRDGLLALVFCFDKKKFLPVWIRLARNWGKASAIRKARLASLR